MNADGKPIASRQLLQRMMADPMVKPVRATGVAAPGRFQQRRRQELPGRRRFVGRYRTSHLGAQSPQALVCRPGAEIRAGHCVSRTTAEGAEVPPVITDSSKTASVGPESSVVPQPAMPPVPPSAITPNFNPFS